MEIRKSIEDMEARLKAAGHSVDAFCRAAQMSRATWTRWKTGKFAPQMQTWTRACEAFEAMTAADAAAE
jgi:hypothetical protein